MLAEKEKAEECGHKMARGNRIQLKRETVGQDCQKGTGKKYHVAMVTSPRELQTLGEQDGEQGGVSSLPSLKAQQKGTLVLEHVSQYIPQALFKHLLSSKGTYLMLRKLPLFLLQCVFYATLWLGYGK